jgi:histidinol-phosphate aminotransferase
MQFRLKINEIPPYLKPTGDRRTGTRLDANENLWGPPPRVSAALRLGSDRIAAYPDEAGKLANSAARRFGARADGLILTNGADEAIYALMSLLAGRGDRVVMPVPGFNLYALAARLHGARIVGVPLGSHFEFRQSRLMKAVTNRTRMVVLVTPNNPTGTEISSAEIEAVAKRAARFDVPVLLDETYAGFSGRIHGRMIRRHPNVIVLGSFSKYFALAGLRLGYVIASPEVISALRAFLPPYSINAAALAAGEAALNSESYYARVRRAIARERKRLAAALRERGLTVFPSAANFVCVRVGAEADRLRKRLAADGIFIKSFPDDPRLSDCLRVTVGRRADNRRFIAAMDEACSSKTLLFDMDGVLVDVSGSYRRAIEQTVFHFSGKRISQAEIQRWKLRPKMNNDWDVAAAILEAKGKSIPRLDLISFFQELYLGRNGRPGLNRSERWLLPAPVLSRLTARHRLGIVTGRPRRDARLALRQFGMTRYFRVVIAREDAGSRQKPDPYGLRLALRRLGARPAFYFGDSPADMIAARKAGCSAIAVCPPGFSDHRAWRRRMAEAGAGRIAESLEAEMEKFL